MTDIDTVDSQTDAARDGTWDRWLTALNTWLKERPSMNGVIPVDDLAELVTVNRQFEFLTDHEEQILATVPPEVLAAVASDDQIVRAARLASVLAEVEQPANAKRRLRVHCNDSRFMIDIVPNSGGQH